MKKFSKLFAILSLCLVVIFAFAACGGGDNDITGKWELTEMTVTTNGVEVDAPEAGMKMTLTIDKDNKFSLTLTPPASSETQGNTVTGTYEFEDNKLTFNDGEGIEGMDMPYLELRNGKLVYEVNAMVNGNTMKAKVVFEKA